MKPSLGSMYAIDAGQYGGSYFVVCDDSDTHITCVQLPDKEVVQVPVNDFNQGMQNDIVKHVADLPESVYAYCKAIYENINI